MPNDPKAQKPEPKKSGDHAKKPTEKKKPRRGNIGRLLREHMG